jgi:hypothetical protein
MPSLASSPLRHFDHLALTLTFSHQGVFWQLAGGMFMLGKGIETLVNKDVKRAAMAPLKRVVAQGLLHHLTQRSNRR